jgi:hypothetical protein
MRKMTLIALLALTIWGGLAAYETAMVHKAHMVSRPADAR